MPSDASPVEPVPTLELPYRLSGAPWHHVFEGVMALVFTALGVGAMGSAPREAVWILGAVALMYTASSLMTRTAQLAQDGIHVGRGWFREWTFPYASVQDVRLSWIGLQIQLFDGRRVTVRMGMNAKRRDRIRAWLRARVGARPFE